jgi:hypothetical protein
MGETEIAGFRRKSYKTLQTLARKTATFHHNINGMDVVQGEQLSDGTCGQNARFAAPRPA